MDTQQVLDHNQANIAEFRSSGGRLSAFGDGPVLLLTSVGAKSGQTRTTPMMYLADEHDPNLVYVFASNAGSDTHPAWFHNLVAHPDEVQVEIGTERLRASASVLPETRRAEVYAVQASRYPGFGAYQEKTRRCIPVIALTLLKQTDSAS